MATRESIAIKAKAQQPIIVPPGGGEALKIGDLEVIRKVRSQDTAGVFSVVEIIAPPKSGIDVHVHEREDELVRILEGSVQVTLGDQSMEATEGVMALLPRGIPHGFTNNSDVTARLLVTILPGALDNYFAELADLSSAEEIERLNERYAVKFL